jgi:hypothetical protein
MELNTMNIAKATAEFTAGLQNIERVLVHLGISGLRRLPGG